MENQRKRSSSDEEKDSHFEFGFCTPDSSYQDPQRSTSPADHLFFNGRLLPHSFPLQPSPTVAAEHMVMVNCRGSTTSRTNSISSNGSLMSSRSNSTNSRSSCSSARTSSSDSSERRLLYLSNKIHATCNSKASKLVNSQLYGDTVQRWQYITAVPPVLERGVSKKKNSGVVVKEALRGKMKSDHHHQGRRKSGPCLGLFRLFLLVCRQCHAMEPSKKQSPSSLA